MKLITAIIQPDKLDQVREELVKQEIYRITVSRVTGRGRAEDVDLYRGQTVPLDLLPKVRLEIACNEEFVDRCIDAIQTGARSGSIGDGKIFVTNLERCVRIRTGEDGGQAI